MDYTQWFDRAKVKIENDVEVDGKFRFKGQER